MTDNANLAKVEIVFPNQRTAIAVRPPASATAQHIADSLALKPCNAVILVLGGAGTLAASIPSQRLSELFRGIARAAAESGATIIDGGRQDGISAWMGNGVASKGNQSDLIGVAPADKLGFPGGQTGEVPAEPNHSHFVLVEGNEWGCETGTLFGLAGALAQNPPAAEPDAEGKPTNKPMLAILANGGPDSKHEVLQTVRQNLPLIVVVGSGGLADEIAACKLQEGLPEDPVMAEIIADGKIRLHPLDDPSNAIVRLIKREVGEDQVLLQAWETFADYDLNANRQQNVFKKLQLWVLCVGLAATFLAIVQTQLAGPGEPGHRPWLWETLRHTLILLPIVLTVLVTASNRFKQGNKWLLLRAGAESIKREIYRYRTRALDYRQGPEPKQTPEQHLSQKLEEITRRTMRTEVNATALQLYDKKSGFPPYMDAAQGGDDGFSLLTPDRYVEFRLGDQLRFFRRRSVKFDQQLTAFYWLTFGIGGLGTLLAAIDQQAWIAFTTAIVAAIGTYLAYNQTESTLTKYNQTATDLENIKMWWNALSPGAQSNPSNIDSLVSHTEQVLQSELDGWVQQMQNALSSLRQEPQPPGQQNREAAPEQPAVETADPKAGEGTPKEPASVTNNDVRPAAAGTQEGAGNQPEVTGQKPDGWLPGDTDNRRA